MEEKNCANCDLFDEPTKCLRAMFGNKDNCFTPKIYKSFDDMYNEAVEKLKIDSKLLYVHLGHFIVVRDGNGGFGLIKNGED